VSTPGLATESLTYNTAACPGVGCGGRVTEITVTSANPKDGTRTLTPKYGYAPDTGFVSAVVDALGRTSSFTRDPVGRVTGAQLPLLSGTKESQNQLGLTYDKKGNVSTIALPSAASTPPVHSFPNYSPIDLLETYEPPQATPALTTRSTTYAYDLDGELTSAVVPDGSGSATVGVTYDSAEPRLRHGGSPRLGYDERREHPELCSDGAPADLRDVERPGLRKHRVDV
jgi:hypothetical protein